MPIEHALLGFFTDAPAYGYEVYQQLHSPEGLWQVWRIKQSQLYALLSRFEEEGWLVASLAPQPSRPARKMLALTDAGRNAFLAWLRSPVDHGRDMRTEFLAKLYFALRIPGEEIDKLIATQREICRSWQEDMPRTLLPKQPADARQTEFRQVVVAFRRTQIDAFIAFLDACASMRHVPNTHIES